MMFLLVINTMHGKNVALLPLIHMSQACWVPFSRHVHAVIHVTGIKWNCAVCEELVILFRKRALRKNAYHFFSIVYGTFDDTRISSKQKICNLRTINIHNFSLNMILCGVTKGLRPYFMLSMNILITISSNQGLKI